MNGKKQRNFQFHLLWLLGFFQIIVVQCQKKKRNCYLSTFVCRKCQPTGGQYSLQTTPLVLIIKVLDNIYQPSDSLGGRYCMWWFFDTEFVHSIYFRDFIFLSVNFTHPVPKSIYSKYYKQILYLFVFWQIWLKASKSQNLENPMSKGAEFSQIFRSFFGQQKMLLIFTDL